MAETKRIGSELKGKGNASMDKIIEQIKKTQWFFGIRREESLFFYSAKYHNRGKFIKRQAKSDFVETVLFPKSKNYLVRLFNLEQSKVFHQESENRILKNPASLEKIINKDYALWKQIGQLSVQLQEKIKQNDYKAGLMLFKKLIEMYGAYGSNFFTIFSLGMKLEKNKNRVDKSALNILKKHDKWRNSVAFKEEKLGKTFFAFLKMLAKINKLEVKPIELMQYLTYGEALNFAEGLIKPQEIENKVESRKSNCYIYLYLRNKKYQNVVIDDCKIQEHAVKHFSKIANEQNSKTGDEIHGQTAFRAKNKIKGTVIVIKDKNVLQKLKPNLANKILVTTQTTPHFIQYLKKVKAIITDEGGITCHAAIISRELKIPCLIGTKNATEVLKDGDLVEIDADIGLVKILGVL
ncbi:hypothetical protein HQ571_00345 [Candidatus Kuenenbacteria bacterium]|nr:hypothetical protein [Candidatus Kuenenbacteria bacterium]